MFCSKNAEAFLILHRLRRCRLIRRSQKIVLPYRFFNILCFIVFLMLAAHPALHSQTRAEKLLKELSSAPPDTHRVSLLYDYAWEITEDAPEVAKQHLQEAIDLSRRILFPSGEANAWNGLGGVADAQNNWSEAIRCYQQSLALFESINDEKGIGKIFNNLGQTYENAGNFEEALVHYRKSLLVREQINDPAAAARAHYKIGSVLQEMGAYPEAYDHINQFRQFVEENRDTLGMARAYTQLGHIRFELDMLPESRRWYARALQVQEYLGDSSKIASALSDLANVLDESDSLKSGVAIPYYLRTINILKALGDESALADTYNNIADAYKHLKQYERGVFYIKQSIQIHQSHDNQSGLMESFNTYGDLLFGLGRFRESLEYVKKYFQISESIQDFKFIQKGYKDLAKVYFQIGEFKTAYEYRVRYDEFRYARLDETRAKDFERKEVIFSEGRRQREIERQNSELALRDAKLSRNRTITITLIGGALLLVLLVALLYNRSRLRARANRELAAKNEAIEQERERADTLLKNILPEITAEELKIHNRVQPVRYDSVSVLFTDFKGFTTIAEQVNPEELIEELDECFRLFDSIISIYGLEKIKTIGDSYMCAGGLPVINDTHPVDMVKAAIDMQLGLKQLMEKKAAEGKPVFEMRIGINTGPVVAGVVGSHKFAYDIWGDTVNTAARLEQGGEPHKINVSESTYQLVKDRFTCVYRGKFPAKNKGEIAMYFVEYDDTIEQHSIA